MNTLLCTPLKNVELTEQLMHGKIKQVWLTDLANLTFNPIRNKTSYQYLLGSYSTTLNDIFERLSFYYANKSNAYQT